MEFVDSHCHLDLEQFDPHRSSLLTLMRQRGVAKLVIPAISAGGWDRLLAVAQSDVALYPALGIHPWCAAEPMAEPLARLEQMLTAMSVQAVGEVGLDFVKGMVDRELQLQRLHPQLALAQKVDLPLILHCRKAHQPLLQLVRSYPGVRGVVHAFSGSAEEAKRWQEHGFLLGIGGGILHPNYRRLQQVVTTLPLSAFLLESDAPYQPLPSTMGISTPEVIPRIAAEIARLQHCSLAEVAEITTANAWRLFRFDH
ncbi:MAG: TatD family hydrolase [Gammaproteobacteria bacterium]|nr:TatD family hydrolase [Gammaproteobacteria bacterium]